MPMKRSADRWHWRLKNNSKHAQTPNNQAARGPVTLWQDIRNILSLNRRHTTVVLLAYMFVSSFATTFALAAVYLMLPLLRDAGSPSSVTIPYEIGLPLVGSVNFQLHWTIPFTTAVLASVVLMLHKRAEYQLLYEGHRVTRLRAEAVLHNTRVTSRERSQLLSCARKTGFALRRLAMCLQELIKLVLASTMLLFLEPAALVVTVAVAIALALFFKRAIWHVAVKDQNASQGGLKPRVKHRLRLANSQQIFSILMPVSVGMMLALARFSDMFGFDLASLILIAVLISVIGMAVSSIFQNLLRFILREEDDRQLLDAIRRGSPETIRRLLQKDNQQRSSDAA